MNRNERRKEEAQLKKKVQNNTQKDGKYMLDPLTESAIIFDSEQQLLHMAMSPSLMRNLMKGGANLEEDMSELVFLTLFALGQMLHEQNVKSTEAFMDMIEDLAPVMEKYKGEGGTLMDKMMKQMMKDGSDTVN